MGLFINSITYSFNFWKENFSKIIEYQLLFLLLKGLALSLFVFVFFVLSSNFPIFIIPAIVFGGIGILLFLVFYLVQFAGYSLMIKARREKKQIKIIKIFRECLSKWHKILVVGILQSLPIIIFSVIVAITIFSFFLSLYPPEYFKPTGTAILPFIRPTGMTALPEIPSILLHLIILLIVLGIVVCYLSLRIGLSLPIFMIEKRACVESVKESWRITKGKCWSIFFTFILMGLIVGTIEAIIELPFNLLGISWIIQTINYLIFEPLLLILLTSYYYSIKIEENKK